VGIYRHDDSFREEGYRVIAGLDEAGRGPIAGPVVAAAVVLPRGARFDGLRDSKKVPEKKRKTLFFDILCAASGIGVGISDVDLIDRVNILEATRLAMAAAVADLPRRPDLLLIDAVKLPSVEIRQVSMFKGESVSASIAAASIVAKVVRDSIMLQCHSVYPQYGFDRHKGYCTREHMEKVVANGPCPLHRKSFEGVMSLMLPF
jgi:ribonuclease HII